MSRLAGVVVAAVALGWAAPAQAFTRQDLRLPMSDGVEVAATLYLPEGTRPSGGWPAIMAFQQTRGALNAIARTYFVPQGYAVLTVDLRGRGESGGLSELDGPREVQDVGELYAWLALRGDVDARRVGALGVSLGGGLVWQAAAEGVPFAAIVPTATWTDLYQALFPGDLSKSGAVLAFLNEISDDRYAPVVGTLRDDLLHSTGLAQVRQLAAARSVAPRLGQIHAPTLVIQGRRDFEFDLGQARQAWRGLRVAKRLYLGDLGHPPADNPPAELPHVYGLVRDWFDRWLKGIPNGVDTGGRVELAPEPWTGRTVRYAGLPPTRELRLTFAGRRTIAAGGRVVRTLRLPRRRLETFGTPVLRVSASSPTGWPRLVASLSATSGRHSVVVADGGVQTAIRGRRDVVLRLTDQATPIPAGARLRLVLATSTPDGLYLNFPLQQGLKITIGRVRLTLPVLRRPVSSR